jgi:hypothetical protein
VNTALKTAALAALALVVMPIPVYSAEEGDAVAAEESARMTPEERRAAWEALSDEEKQAIREKNRARREQKRAEWQAMTPEEREAKREEMRQRMESMTPEQREAMRKRMERRRRHHSQTGGEKEEGD